MSFILVRLTSPRRNSRKSLLSNSKSRMTRLSSSSVSALLSVVKSLPALPSSMTLSKMLSTLNPSIVLLALASSPTRRTSLVSSVRNSRTRRRRSVVRVRPPSVLVVRRNKHPVSPIVFNWFDGSLDLFLSKQFILFQFMKTHFNIYSLSL
jgi:hypothetical protein